MIAESYRKFRNQEIRCPKCGWTGKGRDAQLGEVFELGEVSEYHCPSCNEYLYVVPWPRLGESQA